MNSVGLGLILEFVSNARQLHGELHMGIDAPDADKEDGSASLETYFAIRISILVGDGVTQHE